jgi:murein DD-endopeptidase MepM/ murein hydrolase activator NlpD
MVRMNSKFIPLILVFNLFLTSLCFAKPAPSVGDLKNQVANQNKKISKLKSEISQFEKDLTINHKNYLNVIARKQEIEMRLMDMREAQEALSKNLLIHQEKAKRTLAYQVIHQLNPESEPGQLLARKILMSQLGEQLKLIEAEIKSQQEAVLLLTNLEQRFYEHQKTEIELATVLQELEVRKKTVAQSYLDQQRKLDDLTNRYSQVRAQISRSQARSDKQVTHLRFSAPLQDYQSMDHGDKGVSFSFKGRQPVVSTQEGEIVYAGELSTFGNVVMIDHGDETRSVILGDFIPRAQKGLRVRVGDVIGYTTDRIQQGQVYFEIRKQNTVVNTIHLMDTRVIDSNALAKR